MQSKATQTKTAHIFVITPRTTIPEMITLPLPNNNSTIIIAYRNTEKDIAEQLKSFYPSIHKTFIFPVNQEKIFDITHNFHFFLTRNGEILNPVEKYYLHISGYSKILEAIQRLLAIHGKNYWVVYGTITDTRIIKGFKLKIKRKQQSFLNFLLMLMEKREELLLKDIVKEFAKSEYFEGKKKLENIYRDVRNYLSFIEDLGIIEIRNVEIDKRLKVVSKI